MTGRGFDLTVRGLKVRVRVLPDVAAVDRAAKRVFGRAARGETALALTMRRPAAGGRRVVILPLAGWTPGIVAHEAVHVAVMAGRAADCRRDDEPLAYAVQALTDAICRRLMAMERACA